MAEPGGGAGGPWGRLAGTRLGRWCRALLRDYAEAAREAARGARRRPWRAAGAAAALGGPGLRGGRAGPRLLRGGLTGGGGGPAAPLPPTRSPEAERHVRRLLRRRDRGQLRYRGLVLAAVVYEAPYDEAAALYRARCPHLRPPWSRLPGRLLDVGFWGRWWVLEARTRDCDVNEEEFGSLPPHLRRLEARQLRSEENERLFLQKFRPVPLADLERGAEP
ncbi:mitochondrial import inner membrane translocase subunit Tim29 [Anser cygnoides]|uniref:mitochondrial import inner membrane translocase subunit Tim29 n=1 Tax=Anser cygnoides TaxID=8845 RepID=UPI0034D1BC04